VVAFTTQIPNIEGRVYPPELAGPQYPEGVRIFPESDLLRLIESEKVDQVIFAYSDVSHEYVMHVASTVLAAGADFRLMGSHATQLRSSKPVVSIGAARTGSGKSQTTRRVAAALRDLGYRVAAVRHPMPYGDLVRQAVQRFASYADLEQQQCTIEEREEYEPHIERGMIVFAGVDYERILRQAENRVIRGTAATTLPFFHSDMHIVVVDPHARAMRCVITPADNARRRCDCDQ
jgi:predicted GTPase